MAKKIKTESILNDTGPARYIDPQTDFGFKKLFGTNSNMTILTGFLKALLKYKGTICCTKYLSAVDDPIYAIYCETTNNESFIVELQKADNDYFRDDKNVFYASFPMMRRAKKYTDKYSNLKAIYAIGILDFVFSEDEGDNKYHYIYNDNLSDDENGEEFYDNPIFVYLVLPKFNKKIDELETTLDKWTYVLKNLAFLNERPPELRGIFEKLFRIAEIDKLSPDEKIAYSESQKQCWDMYSILETVKRKAREKCYEEMRIIEEKNNIIKNKNKEIAELKRLINEKTLA
jgi:predicted transposase/invertase (TIGR01784 family)